MTARGHYTFALSIILLSKKLGLFLVLNKGKWLNIIIGVLLTCLLPDIDHPKSFLGHKFKLISYYIYKKYHHRGITHSLFIVILFYFILSFKILNNFYLPKDLIQSMYIGYISHILADILTPAGVCLLWPLKFKFCLPLLNNKKKKQEQILCLLILIIAFIYPFNIKLYYFFLKKINLLYNNLFIIYI